MPEQPRGWGKVLIGTRLEKNVSSRFVQVWEKILQTGLRPGDASYSVRGMTAHRAANKLVEVLLTQTDCDSLLFIDSDAVVPPDIITQLCDYEPGFVYDALQAWYPRRGWPPRPIWMKQTALGDWSEWYVTEKDIVDDVDMIGLHCCLIRREVFETMLGDGDPELFHWFFYPRHRVTSEDGAFSEDAKNAGFRLGVTTAIRTGHICELETNWETYIDFLEMTGQKVLLERHAELGSMVSEFLGEDRDMVIAKAMQGSGIVAEKWNEVNPQTPEEARAFYGRRDNGYLYDLLMWESQPYYQRIIGPLYGIHGQHALVIGPGVGTEIDVLLRAGNKVAAYELPGILHDFVAWRFGDHIKLMDWPPQGEFDAVVAVDVLEHVHPDELPAMLDVIDRVLVDGGLLNMHGTAQTQAHPMHYPNGPAVGEWLARGFERLGDSLWAKR